MSQNSYTTSEVMDNQVKPALRNVLRNIDVDGEVKALIDTGIYAIDELKQSVVDRYFTRFFGDDKDPKLLLLNEMLKATSVKEKLELLKDFLEGIPAYSGKFDPKRFLEDTSRKVAERVKPKMSKSVLRQDDETVTESAVGLKEKQESQEEEIKDRISAQVNLGRDEKEVRLPKEQSVLPPPPPFPFIPKRPVEGSYREKPIGIEGAKIEIPSAPPRQTSQQQQPQIPETPTEARSNPAVVNRQRTPEVQTAPRKKTIMSRIMSPIGVGMGTAAVTGLGLGGISIIESIFKIR